MKPVSILILSDAGAAGRELLARRDVELSWALSVQEARASLERRRPRVVLAQASFAVPFFEASKGLVERVPVVVLVGEDGWAQRAKYFAAGATALVSATSLPRILEAVTELTGLPSRYAPRVPYTEVVDVSIMGSKMYLEAVELGAGGIAIRDFPPARVGDQVEVGLVMMDPPQSLSGMVVRSRVGRGGAVTEVAFSADDAERATLAAFVAAQRAHSAPLPDPVGLTSDLGGGAFTLDLFQTNDSGASDRWIQLLQDRRNSTSETRIPKWLERIERELTEVERRILGGARGPEFARAALEMRIDLGRAQAALQDANALRDACELALDFCRSLATEARAVAPEVLAQVPDIRAGILTQIYGWTVGSGEGESSVAA